MQQPPREPGQIFRCAPLDFEGQRYIAVIRFRYRDTEDENQVTLHAMSVLVLPFDLEIR